MLEVEDSLAAYLLDGAVVTFGTVLENALMETVETGSGTSKRIKPRYTLGQLLDPAFTIPRQNTPAHDIGNVKGTSDGGIMVDTV